jgi:predicted DNA-binding transcriptional regulator AlpA
MQATQRRYLSYAESEVYTGLHRVTLWRAAKSGDLRVSGPAAAPRFDVNELDRWMKRRNER